MKEYYVTIGSELFMKGCFNDITEIARWKFSEDEVRGGAKACPEQEIDLSILKRFARNTLESVVKDQIHTLVRNLCYLDSDCRDTNSAETLKQRFLNEISDDSQSDRFYTIYVYDADDISDDDENWEDNRPDPVVKWSMWKTDMVKEMLGKEK